MKVLIAEDDPVSSLALSRQLKKLGHEVTATKNGRDAWYAYRTGNPQIVITDWIMPVVDGPDLCRMIRTDPGPLAGWPAEWFTLARTGAIL